MRIFKTDKVLVVRYLSVVVDVSLVDVSLSDVSLVEHLHVFFDACLVLLHNSRFLFRC